MTCSFSVGYELGIVKMGAGSLFAEDALSQANMLAHGLNDIPSATNLRMFFCAEVAKQLLWKRFADMEVRCEIEGALDFKFLNEPTVATRRGLFQLRRSLKQLAETTGSITYEMKIRRLHREAADHISAELMNSMLMPSLLELMRLYIKYLENIGRVIMGRLTHRQIKNVGKNFSSQILKELGVSVTDALTVFNYMIKITDRETVDPWTTQIPIFRV